MTKQQRLILEFMNGASWVFGQQILKGTNLKSGTVYPALVTLARKGYVEAEREVGDTSLLGRPLRIHYRITARGAAIVTPPEIANSAPMADSPA